MLPLFNKVALLRELQAVLTKQFLYFIFKKKPFSRETLEKMLIFDKNTLQTILLKRDSNTGVFM